jgi:hypothetical protein
MSLRLAILRYEFELYLPVFTLSLRYLASCRVRGAHSQFSPVGVFLHIFEIFIVGAAENVDLHRSAGQTRSAPKEASRVDPSKITCLFLPRLSRSSSVENQSVFSSVIELTHLVRSISLQYYLEF